MRIRYTPRAFRELQDIFSYLDARSPAGRQGVKARIRAVLDLIGAHPMSGRLVGRRGLRQAVAYLYPYLISYRPSGDEIVVHGVRHAARDPETAPP